MFALGLFIGFTLGCVFASIILKKGMRELQARQQQLLADYMSNKIQAYDDSCSSESNIVREVRKRRQRFSENRILPGDSSQSHPETDTQGEEPSDTE